MAIKGPEGWEWPLEVPTPGVAGGAASEPAVTMGVGSVSAKTVGISSSLPHGRQSCYRCRL